ncbi:hypothetical protein D9M68_261290 [compost metagenome]
MQRRRAAVRQRRDRRSTGSHGRRNHGRGQRTFVRIFLAAGLGHRLADHRLRFTHQRQWQRLVGAGEFHCRRLPIGRGLRRRGSGRLRLATMPLHEPRSDHADGHHRQHQQMLLRQLEASRSRRLARLAALGQHRLDQRIAGHLVDRPRPAAGLLVDVGQQLRRNQLATLPGTLQTLDQILAGLLLAVGLQFDGMEALLAFGQRLELLQQLGLAEQENVQARLAVAGRQPQQHLDRTLAQLLGIVHQQVDVMPGDRQLRHLGQDRVDAGLGDAQPLRQLAQQGRLVSRRAAGNHHAGDHFLVGAGDQGLAQQGLAAAQRTGHRQQQVAVARQVMQLPQHRLALRREEFEAGNPWREGIVAELVVGQEGLVGMQTGHRTSTFS